MHSNLYLSACLNRVLVINVILCAEAQELQASGIYVTCTIWSQHTFSVCVVSAECSIKVAQQYDCISRRYSLHQIVQVLIEGFPISSLLASVGAYALMAMIYWEAYSGKQSFVSHLLKVIGSSGSCLSSDNLIVSPIP